MIDDQDNHIDQLADNPRPDWELPLLLAGAFRTLVDGAHERLAERGHPGLRASHGFALQAVGSGATASELAVRLGVSKQAAAKTVAGLVDLGYVQRSGDTADGRLKLVTPTDRGRQLLADSSTAFTEVVSEWRATAGADAVDQLHRTLIELGVLEAARLDFGAWSSAPVPAG